MAFAVGVYLLALIVIAITYRVLPGSAPPDQAPPGYNEYTGGVITPVVDFVWQVLGEHDLGTSFDGRRVGPRVREAAPVTIAVAAGGISFALVLAALASLIPSRRLMYVFGYVAFGAATIWIGLWLAYLLGFKLGWTPIAGYCDFFDPETKCGGARQWAWHLLLPWLALALPFAAVYARVLRAVRLRLRQDRYLPNDERRRARRLRLASAAKLVGRDFGFALGLSALVELVFGLPGLGHIIYESVNTFDLPLGAGVLVVTTTVALAFQLAVDLVCGATEPELRQP
jgi:peptide/nickel transport system permease protein